VGQKDTFAPPTQLLGGACPGCPTSLRLWQWWTKMCSDERVFCSDEYRVRGKGWKSRCIQCWQKKVIRIFEGWKWKIKGETRGLIVVESWEKVVNRPTPIW